MEEEEEGYDLNSKLKILGVRERKGEFIHFIKRTFIYKKWLQLNYYLYKYIDVFIIHVRREGKTPDMRESRQYYLLSGLFALANYPIYRLYFEFSVRALDKRNVNKVYPNLTQIRKDIRTRSKYYLGFSGFLAGYMVSHVSFYFDKYFNPQNGIYLFAFYHLLSLSLAYPYILNSNYKILKSPKYLSFTKHPFKYIQLMFNKEFYFGYRDWLTMNCLIFIPFFNLGAYKFESFRICRIAAHMYENGETQLKQIEKNLIFSPKPTHYGKYLFNIYPIVFNIYCVFQVFLFICFYDRAGDYVDLWRKDDATRYLEAMERRYPRKPNESYIDLWGPFMEKYRYNHQNKEEPPLDFFDDLDEEQEEEEEDEDDEIPSNNY